MLTNTELLAAAGRVACLSAQVAVLENALSKEVKERPEVAAIITRLKVDVAVAQDEPGWQQVKTLMAFMPERSLERLDLEIEPLLWMVAGMQLLGDNICMDG